MKTGRVRYDSYATDGNRLDSSNISGPTTGPATVLFVDYPHRAWWTYQIPAMRLDPPSAAARVDVYQDPAHIRDAIAHGKMTLLGTEKVNGHDTLHVRVTESGKGLPVTTDFWVDSRTYLPVRATTAVRKASEQASTVNYTWLPRTPENLAALDLQPPAGFRHSKEPIEPRPRPAGVAGD